MKHLVFAVILGISSICYLPAQFQVNGSASSLGNNCFQLTPAQTGQSGAVWSTQSISLAQSVTFYIQMQFGCSDGGADGLAFVLQQSGPTAQGTTGSAMGFGGISPSLVIEFDTYENGNVGDPVTDHMGILSNGSNDHSSVNSLAGPVTISPSGADVEDCQFHDVHISWNAATNTLEVLVDCSLRLTYTGNIVSSIFANNPDVYFGFTASTGALSNDQRVCVEFVPGSSRLQGESICQGDMVSVDATPGSTFNWTPTAGVSNPASGTPSLSPDSTTTYHVTLTDGCGFSWDDSLTVTVATVDAGPNQNIGVGQNTLLNSTYYGPPSVGNCAAYIQSSPPFSPYTLTAPASISLNNGGTSFSGAISLGFNFDFYCNSYNQVYFATGGYLTFTNSTSNTAPTTIPTASLPNNLIAYCWSSLDAMTISYETQGTAPNRRFVVDISALHWFSTTVTPPNGDPVNVQVVLYETGEIDMHISQIAASWFLGMTQGIEDLTGNNGLAVAGRNNVMGWTALNESLRFEPQPASVIYTWTPNTNINNPGLEDPTVFPIADTWYYVTRDDGNCILTDSVFIRINPLDIHAFDQGEQEEFVSNIEVLPNPSHGHIWISGWQEASKMAVFELYTLDGKCIRKLRKELKEGQVNWEIDLSSLPPAMYFYSFLQGEDFTAGKLLLE